MPSSVSPRKYQDSIKFFIELIRLEQSSQGGSSAEVVSKQIELLNVLLSIKKQLLPMQSVLRQVSPFRYPANLPLSQSSIFPLNKLTISSIKSVSRSQTFFQQQIEQQQRTIEELKRDNLKLKMFLQDSNPKMLNPNIQKAIEKQIELETENMKLKFQIEKSRDYQN